MPMYKFVCEKCGASAEVLRTFDEYEVTPTPEEYQGPECEHAWEREIGKTSVIKGPSWGWGKKGSWLWFIAFWGWACTQSLNLPV